MKLKNNSLNKYLEYIFLFLSYLILLIYYVYFCIKNYAGIKNYIFGIGKIEATFPLSIFIFLTLILVVYILILFMYYFKKIDVVKLDGDYILYDDEVISSDERMYTLNFNSFKEKFDFKLRVLLKFLFLYLFFVLVVILLTTLNLVVGLGYLLLLLLLFYIFYLEIFNLDVKAEFFERHIFYAFSNKKGQLMFIKYKDLMNFKIVSNNLYLNYLDDELKQIQIKNLSDLDILKIREILISNLVPESNN